MNAPKTASGCGILLQIKVRLLGVSPMVWRRVLVPETMSLHELHGVLQAAMGWGGIHPFQFNIRSIMHAGPYLHGQPVDVPLSDFRSRRNGKFRYIYDTGCWWEHELRLEDHVSAVPGKRNPNCIGGSSACPPEVCGGANGYFAGREAAMSLNAMEDRRFLAEIIDQGMLRGIRSMLDDEDTCWRVESAAERCRSRVRFLEDRFLRGPVNKRYRAGDHRRLMHKQIM